MSTIENLAPILANEQILEAEHATAPTRPNALSASLTMGWRAMVKIKHVPTQLADATFGPIVMILMFTYVFGGALAGSTEAYLQWLIPGILVMTISMSSSYTALGLNTDIAKGIFDRFRSLPLWRPAVLVGSLLGDMVRYTITGIVVILVGLLLGFRPEAGLIGVMLALGFVLIFAFSLSWIWTALGLLMNDAESVSMMSGFVTFPLLFISNVLVDPATTPSLLEAFMNINPVSLTATVVRGLMHGNVTSLDLIYALLACGVMVMIFAPLTMYLYNHKNTR